MISQSGTLGEKSIVKEWVETASQLLPLLLMVRMLSLQDILKVMTWKRRQNDQTAHRKAVVNNDLANVLHPSIKC
jgi:hypothetical protein